jgi:hypothetical protein
MSSNALSADLQIVCNNTAQRKLFLSMRTPLPRFTPISPYPQNTKGELDMRRKAEILQYKKNSTQGSQLTKSQRWSQLNRATNTKSIICNKNISIATPTSSCDVPGPVMLLNYDSAVPLYNYATNQNSYAQFSELDTTLWSIKFPNDSYQLTVNGTESLVFTLAIQNVIKSSYVYNVTIPIGLYVSGSSKLPTADLSGNIVIKNATLNVYYYNIFSETTPVYTSTVQSVIIPTTIFDISFSFLTNRNTNTFNGSQYIGNVTFPNIMLNTEYGYVYDFKLIFSLQNNTTSYNNSNINNFTYGTVINIPQYDLSANNCIITPQNPTIFENYLPFTLNGI